MSLEAASLLPPPLRPSGVCIRKTELKLEPEKTALAFVECSFRMGILSARRVAETRGKVEWKIIYDLFIPPARLGREGGLRVKSSRNISRLPYCLCKSLAQLC